jgi:hypothetical protein
LVKNAGATERSIRFSMLLIFYELTQVLGVDLRKALSKVELKRADFETKEMVKRMRVVVRAMLRWHSMPRTVGGVARAAGSDARTVGKWLGEFAGERAWEWMRSFLVARPALHRAVINSPVTWGVVWYYNLGNDLGGDIGDERWLERFCPPDVARCVAGTVADLKRQLEGTRAEIGSLKRTVASLPINGVDVGDVPP